jgi:hypothetical protein
MPCPVCKAFGVATGDHDVQWATEDAGYIAMVYSVTRMEKFQARSFLCHVCGLQLNSVAELDAAGMESRVELHRDDPIDFNPPLYEDRFYEWLTEHAAVEE